MPKTPMTGAAIAAYLATFPMFAGCDIQIADGVQVEDVCAVVGAVAATVDAVRERNAPARFGAAQAAAQAADVSWVEAGCPLPYDRPGSRPVAP